MSYIIVALLSAVGATVQAATGFGFPIVLMSLLPVIMPTAMAVSVTALVTPLMNVVLCWRFRKYINYKIIILPLITFVVTNTICTYIGLNAVDVILKRVLGLFLIGLSAYFFFLSNKISIKATAFSGAVAGFISGIVNGLFSIGGPPMVVYLVSSLKDSKEYMGTLQFYFLTISVITVITRAAVGAITVGVLTLGASAVLAIFVGTMLGGYCFKKMDEQFLKKAVYVVMFVTGAIMLILG